MALSKGLLNNRDMPENNDLKNLEGSVSKLCKIKVKGAPCDRVA